MKEVLHHISSDYTIPNDTFELRLMIYNFSHIYLHDSFLCKIFNVLGQINLLKSHTSSMVLPKIL